MIVGTQKPFDEIWEMVKDHKKILVFGCNTCVAICHAGGGKEAGAWRGTRAAAAHGLVWQGAVAFPGSPARTAAGTPGHSATGTGRCRVGRGELRQDEACQVGIDEQVPAYSQGSAQGAALVGGGFGGRGFRQLCHIRGQ